MSVITISRGSFSGGKALAECLADRLGYRCVDRDAIVARAAAYGASQEELRAALQRPPGFWDRFRHTKYVYLTLIQAALAQEVRSGRAVYHGNAGHLLLRGVGHVMRTRIIASLQFRLAAVRERTGLEREEAQAYIEKMDQDRRRWTQYLYGVQWEDPALYDLVVNLESVDLNDACEIITAATRQRCFQENPNSRAAMEDLALASAVRATLATTPSTCAAELDVVAHRGTIVVSGRIGSRDLSAEIAAVARGVEGVSDVRLDVAQSES